MINKIYEIKNKIIEDVEKDIKERGIDRVDGDKIDMIKDLAEAEAYCWKARYYSSIVEAMGEQPSGYGYRSAPMSSGYMGYQNEMGYGNSQMGYDEDPEQLIQKLTKKMQTVDPDKREHIRNRMMSAIGVR